LVALIVIALYSARKPLSRALVLYAAVLGCVDFDLLLQTGRIEWLIFWLPWGIVVAEKYLSLQEVEQCRSHAYPA
jgi:hypothetical protein